MSTLPQTQEKQPTALEQFRGQLTRMEGEVRALLPPSVPVERFNRVVLTVMQSKPELLSMDRKALFAACLNCAKDGLIPDGKEAALVPFKGKPQYMPMIRGIIKTIHNSGGVSTITPNVIREGDKFRYWVDDKGVHLEHEPNMLDAPGAVFGVYAIAKMHDGATEIEVMSKAEVDKVRAVSLAKSGGPWNDWYDEMAKKTVIRRLAKRLPLSAEAERVIQRDDDMYDLDGKAAAAEKSAEVTDAIRASMAKQVDPTEEGQGDPNYTRTPPTQEASEPGSEG